MTNQNIERKKVYRLIREGKRKGDIKAIAEKLNKSRQWVSLVCSPQSEYWDEDVIAAIIIRIEDRKSDAKKVIRKYIKKYV